MPKPRVCKFFAQGNCLKGASCSYSHDRKVCYSYQEGKCRYGDNCRFEHLKRGCRFRGSVSSLPKAHVVPGNSSSELRSEHNIIPEDDTAEKLMSSILTNKPICAFAAAGKCIHGEICPDMHGDLCSTCGKHCLHPYRAKERDEHRKHCEQTKKHLEALRCSEEIECCVCFERVLSKPNASERKFGLLSECDHPFCISCIRNWRSSSSSSGIDVNSAIRACPICRKVSYFVIPSVTWYSTKQEKQEIIRNYKSKLSSIDCKYYDFGFGICPFGARCFYKHEYQPDKHRPNTSKSGGANMDARFKLFARSNGPHHFNSNELMPSDESSDEDIFDRLIGGGFIERGILGDYEEFDDFFAEAIREQHKEFLKDIDDDDSDDFFWGVYRGGDESMADLMLGMASLGTVWSSDDEE